MSAQFRLCEHDSCVLEKTVMAELSEHIKPSHEPLKTLSPLTQKGGDLALAVPTNHMI